MSYKIRVVKREIRFCVFPETHLQVFAAVFFIVVSKRLIKFIKNPIIFNICQSNVRVYPGMVNVIGCCSNFGSKIVVEEIVGYKPYSNWTIRTHLINDIILGVRAGIIASLVFYWE